MAYNNYYLDLCVDTYVVCGNRVLIRMHEKYYNWGSVGGHKADEDQDAECRWVTQVELDEMLSSDPRMRKEVHRYASEALKVVQAK